MRAHRRLSEAEREQRREQDRQRLHQATEQLLDSDGWQRWVRVRSRNGLARYSINNQLLIALAMPDATYVCGFRAWLTLGYQVRKGEKAIRILAPMPIKIDPDTDGNAEKFGGETRRRMLFRVVPVFDRSQVDAIPGDTPTPLAAPCEPLTGNSHAHLIEPLQRLADSLGFVVAFEQIRPDRRVVRSAGQTDRRQRRSASQRARAGAGARARARARGRISRIRPRARRGDRRHRDLHRVRWRWPGHRRGVDPICRRVG